MWMDSPHWWSGNWIVLDGKDPSDLNEKLNYICEHFCIHIWMSSLLFNHSLGLREYFHIKNIDVFFFIVILLLLFTYSSRCKRIISVIYILGSLMGWRTLISVTFMQKNMIFHELYSIWTESIIMFFILWSSWGSVQRLFHQKILAA